MRHYETGNEWFNDRPKAAIISLVRNEELEGILQSMRQLEYHWNKRYRYPWVFFSEKDFSDEFKVSLCQPFCRIRTSDHVGMTRWNPFKSIRGYRTPSTNRYMLIGSDYECHVRSNFIPPHPQTPLVPAHPH